MVGGGRTGSCTIKSIWDVGSCGCEKIWIPVMQLCESHIEYLAGVVALSGCGDFLI